jgi:hypothetical protein
VIALGFTEFMWLCVLYVRSNLEEIRAVVSPVTSKCTTLGRIKVHHP